MEKERLALVTAVQGRRHYLLGRYFTIKTDHHSLKFLLEQRITAPSQQKWWVKFMGYDYDISYKKWKENIVVDALSRKDNSAQLCSISVVHTSLLDEVKLTWAQEPSLQKLM